MKIWEAPYKEWLGQFNLDDPVNILKINHIKRVVGFARKISGLLNLSKEDTALAVFIAQHHDDGRFVQWRDYRTFKDGVICDDGERHPHAELSLGVLIDENKIKQYSPDISDEECAIVYKAIAWHGSLSVDTLGMSSREVVHCNIIRDADMLDNLVNVMIKETMETLMGSHNYLVDELWDSVISDGVFDSFISQNSINYGIVETPADWWLAMTPYLYNINFEESLQIVKASNCIEKIFDRVDGKFQICQTNNKIKLLYLAADAYIDDILSTKQLASE